jgi:hypothetical protein
LEVILEVEPEVGRRSGRREAPPAPTGLQLPGVGFVEERPVQYPEEPLLDLGVVDGHDHLDPPVEVPLHEVG